MDPDQAEQALEVGRPGGPPCGAVTTTPRDSSAGAALERDDLGDDQLGGVAAAVERPLDEADQVVLDEVFVLGELLGPEHRRDATRSGPRR